MKQSRIINFEKGIAIFPNLYYDVYDIRDYVHSLRNKMQECIQPKPPEARSKDLALFLIYFIEDYDKYNITN